MTKRLQVLLDEAEYREIKKIARQQHLTVAEWVRQALRLARRREPLGGPERKLDAVRAAAQHAFPTADIEVMLQEIERGYLADSDR